MGHLDSVYISGATIFEECNEKDLSSFVKNMPTFWSLSWSISFPLWIKNLNQLTELFSLKCSYLISNYSGENEDGDIDLKALSNDENITTQLSKIVISRIVIWYQLSPDEYFYIWNILSF